MHNCVSIPCDTASRYLLIAVYQALGEMTGKRCVHNGSLVQGWGPVSRDMSSKGAEAT